MSANQGDFPPTREHSLDEPEGSIEKPITKTHVSSAPPGRPSQAPKVIVPRPSRPPPALDEPFSDQTDLSGLPGTEEERVARRSFAPPPHEPAADTQPVRPISTRPSHDNSTAHVSVRPVTLPSTPPDGGRRELTDDDAKTLWVLVIGVLVLSGVGLLAWFLGGR